MSIVEVGQVLSLRIRFNNAGDISSRKHPYLIVGINEDMKTVEIAQLDSLAGKEYKALFRANKLITFDNPTEKVIDKDSYIQMDNTILIDLYDDLINFRRQADKLSDTKLSEVLEAYSEYHQTNEIDENKQVYMDRNELEALNCN